MAFKHNKINSIDCSWIPNPSSLPINNTVYLTWAETTDCRKCTTTSSAVRIKNSYLFTNWQAFIWLFNGSCMERFSIIIHKSCNTPSIMESEHVFHTLRFKLDNVAEMRYRGANSTTWHYINATTPEFNVSLPEPWQPGSFIAQLRCSPASCSYCEWGRETTVPHKLTVAPSLTLTAQKISPGKQKVCIEWKFAQSAHADEYILKVQREPASCRNRFLSMSLPSTGFQHQLNLSMAYFIVSVCAKNKAGESPTASSLVPLLPAPDLPGKIFAAAHENRIFLTWTPKFLDNFFVVDWGTDPLSMGNKIEMQQMENYSLSVPKSTKPYTIKIHLYDRQTCGDVTQETTFGITHIYGEEGVPRTGPVNITIRNITARSAAIQWHEIPKEERLGFLVGYRLYITDVTRNQTLHILVNDPTQMHYQLTELRSGNEYEVRISGRTKKGDGIPSTAYAFRTLSNARTVFVIICMTCIGVGLFVSVGTVLLSRKKDSFFPDVPDPQHSNIVNISKKTTAKQWEKVPTLLFLQDDCSWDAVGVEVIENGESLQLGSSTKENSSLRMEETPLHDTKPELSTGIRARTSSGTFNMASSSKSFKDAPLLTNHSASTMTVTQNSNVKTQAFYDYIREVPRTGMLMYKQAEQIQLVSMHPIPYS
ncbi:oncostatin-M-specific receptor subunit beta-like [Xenopus tropicalis]|nr:oncostatin-M-specific receptor subunit beta-like [Xenopus tropicalis]